MAPTVIGMLGLGNVGTGVVEYLLSDRRKPGQIYLKMAAVQDLGKKRGARARLTTDPYRIIDDPEIKIVVEIMGGEEPAREYIMQSLERGKSVVTANKVLIAKYGREIFDAARRKGVDVFFEGAVAGGVPVIRVMRESLSANQISRILAILNGTTNYILTRQSEEMSYDEALKDAQSRGFAEANSELDVSGRDARDKLAILASLAFDTPVDPDKIYCEGITGIASEDIDYAAEEGLSVKLLGVAKRRGNTLELRVHPTLIPQNHPLAGVRYEYNAVYLEGDLCGPQMYYGRGAGRKPTTSAVLSDIFRAARNKERGVSDSLPELRSSLRIVGPEKVRTRGYFRMNLKHVPGTLSAVTGVFGSHGIQVEDSIQRRKYRRRIGREEVFPNIITIEETPEAVIQKALEELSALDRVVGTPVYIRIEQ
ncbi:MAG: homoserine dehydrogenase [Candidatus Aenigmarchaeota archaeon]|nr:homoserine dehydrogenase [Candidatus Aenigmarchaeota archaeon]